MRGWLASQRGGRDLCIQAAHGTPLGQRTASCALGATEANKRGALFCSYSTFSLFSTIITYLTHLFTQLHTAIAGATLIFSHKVSGSGNAVEYFGTKEKALHSDGNVEAVRLLDWQHVLQSVLI